MPFPIQSDAQTESFLEIVVALVASAKNIAFPRQLCDRFTHYLAKHLSYFTVSSHRSVPASSEEDPWTATVSAACDGSRAAQSRLFEDLRAYLRSRAGAAMDQKLSVKMSPSDLVQETMLEAYRCFNQFEGKTRSELAMWLQGILTNQARLANRRYRGAAKRDLRREGRAGSGNSGASRWQPVDEAAVSPSGEAVQNEELDRLEQAISRLPPRQEQVIRLRNELRFTFIEIGQSLDCSVGAAEKLWVRAIERLTRELNDG